jgi:hypothetical protein
MFDRLTLDWLQRPDRRLLPVKIDFSLPLTVGKLKGAVVARYARQYTAGQTIA